MGGLRELCGYLYSLRMGTGRLRGDGEDFGGTALGAGFLDTCVMVIPESHRDESYRKNSDLQPP